MKKIAREHSREWRALVEKPSSFALTFFQAWPLGIEYLREVMKEFARCGRHPDVSGDGGSFVSEMCLVSWKILDPSYKI